VKQQKQGTPGVYFEIYQQESEEPSGNQSDLTGGAWRWRLKSADHEAITSAESYAQYADCLHAVLLVRRTSTHTPIRDV
jgi:uncharacterized protein YegP (UPF0339 family)